MKAKNYRIEFLTGDREKVSAEDAAQISKAWGEGAKFIIVNGNVYATHQIKSIKQMRSAIDVEYEFVKAGLLEERTQELVCDPASNDQWKEQLKKLNDQYSITNFLKNNNTKLLS
jgi:hypothetical protein